VSTALQNSIDDVERLAAALREVAGA
jgi:hypothetical protein